MLVEYHNIVFDKVILYIGTEIFIVESKTRTLNARGRTRGDTPKQSSEGQQRAIWNLGSARGCTSRIVFGFDFRTTSADLPACIFESTKTKILSKSTCQIQNPEIPHPVRDAAGRSEDDRLVRGFSAERRPLFDSGCRSMNRRLFVSVTLFMQGLSEKEIRNMTIHFEFMTKGSI